MIINIKFNDAFARAYDRPSAQHWHRRATMDFTYSDVCEDYRRRVQAFMDAHVLPRAAQAKREHHEGRYPLSFMEELKATGEIGRPLEPVPAEAARRTSRDTGLSNLDYAPIAEIMGRVDWASEVFNCNAPDTGNMELLHMFATPAQARALAEADAERRIPFGLRHDRAGRRLFRCNQHPDLDPQGRRRLRHQRPQMVHHQPEPQRLRPDHRHGQDRLRRARAPAAEHGAGAARHPRRRGRAQHLDAEPHRRPSATAR